VPRALGTLRHALGPTGAPRGGHQSVVLSFAQAGPDALVRQVLGYGVVHGLLL
jgi:hypothetical protein